MMMDLSAFVGSQVFSLNVAVCISCVDTFLQLCRLMQPFVFLITAGRHFNVSLHSRRTADCCSAASISECFSCV